MDFCIISSTFLIPQILIPKALFEKHDPETGERTYKLHLLGGAGIKLLCLFRILVRILILVYALMLSWKSESLTLFYPQLKTLSNEGL